MNFELNQPTALSFVTLATDLRPEYLEQGRAVGIPHARIFVYEGTGHALHWEAPAAFAAKISAFIAERTKNA